MHARLTGAAMVKGSVATTVPSEREVATMEMVAGDGVVAGGV